MSDERNDRPKSDDTPPPLVPPPVFSSRADDTTAVTTTSPAEVAAEEAARQSEVDRAAADARDLGTTPTAASDSATSDDAGDANDHGVGDRHDHAAEYAAVEEPAPDAVEDHTVIRDAGDLEPETDPATYPAVPTERESAETRAYDPVPVAGAATVGAGAGAAVAAGSVGDTEGRFPPAPAQPRTFTPPPVVPKKKGNRGVGTLIAVLSVIVFAVVYALVAAVVIAVQAPGSPVLDIFTEFVTNSIFYVPAIFFVVAFVLVVLVVNRANWWAFVLGSLVVGVVVYFGTIGTQLLMDSVFAMTQEEAAARFAAYAANPFVIAAGLAARETSIWIGSAISARGRRVKAKNVVARDEYERLAAEHRAEYERGYAPTA